MSIFHLILLFDFIVRYYRRPCCAMMGDIAARLLSAMMLLQHLIILYTDAMMPISPILPCIWPNMPIVILNDMMSGADIEHDFSGKQL